MLNFTFTCGKDIGKWYAACAICACGIGNGNRIIDDGNVDHITIKLTCLQSSTQLSALCLYVTILSFLLLLSTIFGQSKLIVPITQHQAQLIMYIYENVFQLHII